MGGAGDGGLLGMREMLGGREMVGNGGCWRMMGCWGWVGAGDGGLLGGREVVDGGVLEDGECWGWGAAGDGSCFGTGAAGAGGHHGPSPPPSPAQALPPDAVTVGVRLLWDVLEPEPDSAPPLYVLWRLHSECGGVRAAGRGGIL